MNSKIHLRKISLKAYLKFILHHFGLNSFSGSTADGCTSFWFDQLVTSIGRERTNSLLVCLGVREKQGFDGKTPKRNALLNKTWQCTCLVSVRRLFRPSRSMHFGDVSETNVRNTPRQSRSAHTFVFTKKKTKTIWKLFLWLSRLFGNHFGGFSFNYNRNATVKRHRVSLSW